MNDEFDSLFGTESTEEVTDTVEETVEEIEAETEAETVEETIEEEAIPEAEPKGEMVPLAALKAERDRAQAYRAEVDRLSRQYAEEQAARAQNELPDPYVDPEGYQQFLASQIDSRVQQRFEAQKLEAAIIRAEQEHGEAYLAELVEWADAATVKDPTLGDRARAASDPVAFIADLKKRSEALAAFEADPDTFIREEAMRRGLIPTVENSVAAIPNPTPKKSVGPKSIASAPSVGATNKGTDSDDAFDAIYR